MSSLERRAWLSLWSMCPAYLVYFAIQIGSPSSFTTLLERFACLAAVASFHAVVYVAGLIAMKRRETKDEGFEDERDRAIDARATRIAYFVMLTGMILVGMVMPFGNSGWQIVNSALFVIVVAETTRYALIVAGYRSPRFAY